MELYGSLFNISGSVTASAFTGSFVGDGSGLFGIQASGVTGLNLSQIASGDATASITTSGFTVNKNTQIQGNLSVSGALTANEYIVSSSVIYMTTSFASGSSAFGDDLMDTHKFTGSVQISGSISLNGVAIGTGKLDETTFQSYTSSNNSRVTALETSSGSLNSFTSSINTTIKSKLDSDNVISGSAQVVLTGTTGYSTFSSSVSTSIGSLSSSIATTDSNQEGRLNALETSSGSLNSFTSSINTTIKSKLDTESVISGSAQVNITGTTGYSTFSSSISNSINNISGAIATTTSGLTSTITSLSSSLTSSIGELSSSVATTTLNLKNRVDSIETSTGSLNSFTSSINTTIKSKLDTENVISGSVQVNITGTTGYSTFSSSVSSSIGSLSSSVATTTNDLSSSLTSSIGSLSSSVATTTSGLSSSIGSLSSSVATTTLNQSGRLTSIEGKTGSYATTGSNVFQGSQTITGSLFISQDLIVAGSSSIQHISSSVVNIADNIITVNAINPSVRFGGLAVIDSGSSPQVSGSILFDSVNNQWLFVHQNQTTVTSSVLLMGPETYNNVGNETYITANRLVKSTGIEHLTNSNISDDGTTVTMLSNTIVNGTFSATGTTLVSGSSQISHDSTTGYVANRHIDHTAVSISAGNGLSGGGDISSTRTISLDTTSATFTSGVKTKMNTDGVVSGSSQISFTSITDKPTLVSGSSQITFGSISSIPSGLVSGSSQITFSGISSLPTLVSGSSQIDLTSTTNYSTGIKTRLNAEGVFSGSAQVSLTSTQVTNGLGYTPYNATNPNGYITGINSSAVTTALGYTPYNSTNPSGYISGISFANVSSKPTTISGYGITDAITTGNIGSQTVSNSSQLQGLNKAQLWNNSGQNHSTYQTFAAIPNFGVWFMQASAAADTPQSASQYYVQTQGLGNDYAYGTYGLMTAVARDHAVKYTYYRTQENGTWGAWTKAAAGYADTAGSLSSMNISQFTNNSGYITGVTNISGTAASETLSTVTTRGNSTAQNIVFTNGRKGLVGVYDAAQTQAVFAMGIDYILTNGGASSTIGNLYGLAWSYNPDYGGAGNNPQSKAGLNHQLLHMQNGITTTAIGSGIWTSGGITCGTILPLSNNAHNLGSTGTRWANIYTNDLHLSNEGKEGGNEIDGTTGDWTIQEGEENLYIINHKNGKKFKIDLTEIV